MSYFSVLGPHREGKEASIGHRERRRARAFRGGRLLRRQAHLRHDLQRPLRRGNQGCYSVLS